MIALHPPPTDVLLNCQCLVSVYRDNIGHTMMLTRRTVSLCQHRLIIRICDGDDYEFVVYRNTRPCIRKREANDRNYYGYNWYKFVTLFQWWQRYPDGSLSPVINSVTVLVIHFPCLEGETLPAQIAVEHRITTANLFRHTTTRTWSRWWLCSTIVTPRESHTCSLQSSSLQWLPSLTLLFTGTEELADKVIPKTITLTLNIHTLTIKSSWVMLYVTYKLEIHPHTQTD